MFSLAEEIPSRMSEAHVHTAQLAYVMAKTMGGYEGEPTDFLLDFANPGVKPRPVFISRAVEESVQRALAFRLVSQEMLDLIGAFGYQI